MRKQVFNSRGASLVELLVVLAIIGIMLSLLFPAIHASRGAARRTQCKNNLHQMAIAMAHFVDTRHRLPESNKEGTAGGWAIEILPFMEETNLYGAFRGSLSLDLPAVREFARKRPTIMRCPDGYEGDSTIATIPVSHYNCKLYRTEYVSQWRNSGWAFAELGTETRIPWVVSQEDQVGKQWPHNGGYHVVSGFGSGAYAVEFVPIN